MSKRIPPDDTIVITQPTGMVNVNTDMGLNIVPANGEVVVPTGYRFSFVYGAVYQDAATPPEIGEAQSGDIANGQDFSFPGGLYGAACNSAGTAVNYVRIWAIFEDLTEPVEETVPETGQFTGKCVSTAARRRRVTQTTGLPGFPLDYETRVGKWLQYRNAAVSHPHEGSILLNKGKPLLASSIAIAADRVLWRTKDCSETEWIELNSPRGWNEDSPDDGTWRFKSIPKYSIVVWQIGSRQPRVIRSQSPLNPTVITGLNNRSPIFVQVNDMTRKYSDNFGAFDVWVRVEAT